jgi:hypothetical protein
MDQDLKQQVNDLERKLNNFIDQYDRNSGPSSQIFTKKVTIAGGLSLNGSSLGSVGDSMSVYGETPVPQAVAVSIPTAPGATYVQAEAQSAVNSINAIRNALSNFGITA